MINGQSALPPSPFGLSLSKPRLSASPKASLRKGSKD